MEGIMRNIGTIDYNLAVVDNKAKKALDSIAEQHKVYSKTFVELQTVINDASVKTRLLHKRIGVIGKSGDGSDPSLWEAFEEGKRELSELKGTLSSLESTMGQLRDAVNIVEEDLPIVSDNLQLLTSSYKSTLQDLKNRVSALEQQPARGGNVRFDPRAERDSEELRVSLEECRSILFGGGHRESMVSLIDRLKSDMVDRALKGEAPGGSANTLEDLVGRLKDLEAKNFDDKLYLNGRNFTSRSHVGEFMAANGGESAADFWDLFSILCSVSEAVPVTAKELADRRHSAKRLKMTALEADLSSAMGQERPRILFGNKKGDMAKEDQGFLGVPSYASWIGTADGTSAKGEITNKITAFVKGVKGVLSARYGTSSAMYLVCVALLDKSLSQWGAFCDYVEKHYTGLTLRGKFKTGPAWNLSGRTGKAFFDACRVHRTGAALLEDVQDPTNKAVFAWAVLESTRIMDGFVRLDFSAHPGIVKEISNFMVTERVDKSEMDELETRVKVAEAAAKSASDSVKSLDAQLSVNKRTAGDQAQALLVLKKRLDGLDKR